MHNSTILVVDDQPQSIELLRSILRDFGFFVLTAVDKDSLFAVLEKVTPDMILLDIMMPETDGFQLCTELRKNPKTGDVPIIFLTALDQKHHVLRGLKAGAVDYITKPFDVEEVIARINVQLEIKRSKEMMLAYNNELEKRNKIYEEEIRQAIRFIRSILPPKTGGKVKTDYFFMPSQQLGGDTFNYYDIDSKHKIFYILDVSGHGLVAALLSISLTNILRSNAIPNTDFLNPSDVLNNLNRLFKLEQQGGKYFTIWYGVLDTEEMILTYATAGHPSPAIIRRNNNINSLITLEKGGVPVGIFANEVYHNFSIQLLTNDILYLFSDGTFELDEHVIHFSYDDFLLLLQRTSIHTSNRIKTLVDSLMELNKSTSFADDFSILEIEFAP